MKLSFLALGAVLVMTSGCAATPSARSSAVDYYLDTCEGGDAVACSNGARALTRRNASYHDDVLAMQLRARACELNARYCADVGHMYFEGKGVQKDEKRGVAYLDKACAVQHLPSCSTVAAAYERGQGVQLDKAKAQALYEKTCTAGLTADCTRAGELLLAADTDTEKTDTKSAKSDKTAPRDEARARALYEKACKAGEELACAVLDTKSDTKLERKLPKK